MKHTATVTILMLGLFLISQAAGLGFLAYHLDVTEGPDGISISHPDTAVGERPNLEGGASIAFLLGSLLIGTVILLILIKFKTYRLWKLWYFLAVWVATSIAIGVIFPAIAILTGFLLACYKLWKPNHITQNATEVLMYSGLAILFVPLLQIRWVILLLILISFYDMYAVWKSKHMIKLAKFTSDTNLFAGFSIPYKKTKHTTILSTSPSKSTTKTKVAILGGGDITFPLFLSGSTLEWLIIKGYTLPQAYFGGLLVSIGALIGLAILLGISKRNTFYPAMPPITIGAFIALGIITLVA